MSLASLASERCAGETPSGSASDDMSAHPDVVVILTDQERAPPPYEDAALGRWRDAMLPGRRWFAEHGVVFERHYTGSLACVPSRPTLFTGHYPDLHGVSQTDGFGKLADDSRMRWLRPGEVPTLGHYFRAAGYDTHYDGKWHLSHADLMDPATGEPLATNRSDGAVIPNAVQAYLEADPLGPYGFSGWGDRSPTGGGCATAASAGIRSSRAGSWPGSRSGTPDGGRATSARCAPFCSSRAS